MQEWTKVYDTPFEEPANEWFVNRKRELNFLWKWLSSIPYKGPRQSYALVGLRRTGKTAVMHKLFNRLFNEQDTIIPVYVSFLEYLNRDEPITSFEFGRRYFTEYVRSYLAFKHKRPELHSEDVTIKSLRTFAEQHSDPFALELFDEYDLEMPVKNDPDPTAHYGFIHWAINLPRGRALVRKIPTAIFIDEFQVLTEVRNLDDGRIRNVADFFRRVAEANWSPLLLSGSSVSMLRWNALAGSLSGRVSSFTLEALGADDAVKMISKLGQHLNIPMTDDLTETIFETTQGYPYSIERILFNSSEAATRFPDPEAVTEILKSELHRTRGELGQHYEREYGKYVRELNDNDVTRKIFYWVTNQPGTPENAIGINPRRVANDLGLELIETRDSLDKLEAIDIITRGPIGTFYGPTDPLLREYLNFAHHVNINDLDETAAEAQLTKQMNRLRGETNRKIGHLAEIIVGGVLRHYDDRTVDGERYFGIPGEVKLPRMWHRILRREGVIKEDRVHEIDLIGLYTLFNDQEDNGAYGAWMVSVRYREQRMGKKQVEQFIRDTEVVQQEKGYGEIRLWYFSSAGFTAEAQAYLREQGIYFSDLAQFNQLADLFDVINLTASA